MIDDGIDYGDGIDHARRRFLTNATCAVGAVGVAAAAIPFVGSWSPSAKAKAAGAPVRINISKIEVGQMVTFEWRAMVRLFFRSLSWFKV